jgi:hypothetical protein
VAPRAVDDVEEVPARRSLLPSSDRAAAFALAGVAVLALSALHQLTGFGGATFAAWYLTFVFGSCGLIVLARVPGAGAEWPAWALLGSGLVIYSAGTVVFNFAFADDTTAPFPSVADGLWLTLYPLAAAGIVVLVRRRLGAVTAALWLDGVIIGGVVAAAAAAVVFDPVLETTVANGAASVARLLYPLGDLLALGLVVAVSSFGGRRPDARWSLLAAGFALLGASDTLYVIQAAAGTWAPGAPLDIPYAAATMLLAAAAWQPSRPLRVDRDRPARRFALPLALRGDDARACGPPDRRAPQPGRGGARLRDAARPRRALRRHAAAPRSAAHAARRAGVDRPAHGRRQPAHAARAPGGGGPPRAPHRHAALGGRPRRRPLQVDQRHLRPRRGRRDPAHDLRRAARRAAALRHRGADGR